MNVWKIGSRWSDQGSWDSSILHIFKKYNIVFAGRNTEYIKREVSISDLIAVADGTTVVAVGKVKSVPKPLNKFKDEGFINALVKNNILHDSISIGFEVELYELNKNEQFVYIRGTFNRVHGDHKDKIIELFDAKLKNTELQLFIPQIEEIFIEKYRAIDALGIKDIPSDTQWLFLTGENGFGKTSILRSLMIGLEGIAILEESEPPEFMRITYKSSKLPQNKKRTNIISVNKEENFIKFSDFENIIAYGAKRTDIRVDRGLSEIHESLFEKDTALFNFESKYKDWCLFKEKHKTKIEGFEKLLKYLLPNLSRIDIEPENSRVVYFEMSDSGSEFNNPVLFSELAMGMRSIIAMISDMVFRFTKKTFDFKIKDKTIDLSGIVIIDEFDNHLHPKWQKMLVIKLTELFPKVQFIVSTHSPIPLLGAPLKHTVILNVNRTKEEGITVKRLEKLEKELPNLLPNAILTSPIFGLDSIKSESNKDIDDLVVDDNYHDREEYKKMDRQIDDLFKKNNWSNNELFSE